MTEHLPASGTGLEALESRLRQDLSWLEYPAKAWVPPRQVDGERVRDVVIVGAGMCGLVASAMLKRLGVANIVVYDQSPEGQEGPWVTFARMRTLRSPKQLTGPAMGLPALTVRAWYEARFGTEAWEKIEKVPRDLWMEYLVWYRKVLDLPIENNTRVTNIHARGDGLLEIAIDSAGSPQIVLSRRLVLATGRDGLGGPFVPDFVRKVDRRFWAHSAEMIDFKALRGKRVGVVGAGASAMDNAATALEAGAARLDLFIRRADIPRINKFTGIGSQGVVHGFAGLPDEWKWKFLDYTLSTQTPPPRDSTLRVSNHKHAFFRLGSPVTGLKVDGDHLLVSTPKGRFKTDFMIFATGFRVDLSLRSELKEFIPHIRFWGDRFHAPEGMSNGELEMSPDLGEGFEFLEKHRGECPALKHIHCFNFPSTLSHGKLTGDIPAVSEGADRLARAIVRSLFVEDRDIHFSNLQAFSTPEIFGDEWVDASLTDGSSDAAA